MSTPAEVSRQARSERSRDIHEKAAEGCIKLREHEDWVEYYHTEKRLVFYFCVGSNYKTNAREKTPFKTPARPELGAMPEFDETGGKGAFVPQQKFVSKLLQHAGDTIEVEEIGGGAAQVIKFRDVEKEKIALQSRTNKYKSEQAKFIQEQADKKVAEELEQEKQRQKRAREEEKEALRSAAKKRRMDTNDEQNQKMAGQFSRRKGTSSTSSTLSFGGASKKPSFAKK